MATLQRVTVDGFVTLELRPPVSEHKATSTTVEVRADAKRKHATLIYTDYATFRRDLVACLTGELPAPYYSSLRAFWAQQAVAPRQHPTALGTEAEVRARRQWEWHMMERVHHLWRTNPDLAHPKTLDVLEPACGTGFWTNFLAPRFRTVHRFDAFYTPANEHENVFTEAAGRALEDAREGEDSPGSRAEVLLIAGWAMLCSARTLARYLRGKRHVLLVESVIPESSTETPGEVMLLLQHPSTTLGAYTAVYRRLSWWRRFIPRVTGLPCRLEVYRAPAAQDRSARVVMWFAPETAPSTGTGPVAGCK